METERFDAFSDLLKTASLNLQQFLYLLKAMRQRDFLRDKIASIIHIDENC